MSGETFAKNTIFMDNCGARSKDLNDPRGQVYSFNISSKYTGLFQQTDLEVTACLGKQYHEQLIIKIPKNMESRQA